jgi:hypothetical protein
MQTDKTAKLRELVRKRLKEMSATGAIGVGAGPIRTPYAFSRPGQKTNAATQNAKKMGMKPVKVVKEGQAIMAATELETRINKIMKDNFGNLGSVADRDKVRQEIRQALINAYADLDFIVKEAELSPEEEENLLRRIAQWEDEEADKYAGKNYDDFEAGAIYESKVINEVSYRSFRRATEATPRQKINNAMREIKFMMRDIEGTVDNALRLKEEMGVKSGNYWKRTNQYLSLVSEKLTKLSNKIKELSQ